jgi:hypothetical protein
VEGCYTPESGYAAMNLLLEQAVLPTAVFVGSDVVAFGAMTAAHERGLSIPGDLAFVGFDDVPLARYAVPPLTTVRMPAVEMGACWHAVDGTTSGRHRAHPHHLAHRAGGARFELCALIWSDTAGPLEVPVLPFVCPRRGTFYPGEGPCQSLFSHAAIF